MSEYKTADDFPLIEEESDIQTGAKFLIWNNGKFFSMLKTKFKTMVLSWITDTTQSQLDSKLPIADVLDVLDSVETQKALSANKGKELSDAIDNILTILGSDETDLDTLQEIVDYIQQNADDLANLGIANIAGLQSALDAKASITGVETLTNKRITPRVLTAGSNTLSINSDSYDEVQRLSANGSITINNPTGTPTEGQPLVIRIRDNNTSRSISFGSNFRAIGSALPTNTTANKLIYIGCLWNSGDGKWDTFINEES